MKIFHLALQSPGEPNHAITRSMRERGHQVEELNWVEAIRSGAPAFRRDLVQRVRAYSPDLLFMQLQNPAVIDNKTAKELSALTFTLNWTGDVRADIGWYHTLGKDLHLTLFSNYTDVRKSQGIIPVDYLQVGYDEQIYTPDYTVSRTDKVVFLGNNYKHNPFPLCRDRRTMVGYLRQHVPRFELYGAGWEGSRHLNPQAENAIYRESLAAINQNHFDYELFSSDRILRIMGSGCLCLTRYFTGLEAEYTPGINLLTWNNLTELKEQIEWVRANPEQAEVIARTGADHVRENCRWHNRIDRLIELYHQYKTT
jgi:hypothetical protein